MTKALKLACLSFLALVAAGCGKKVLVPEKTVVAVYVDFQKAYDDGKDLAKEVIDSLPSDARKNAEEEFKKAVEKIDNVAGPLKPKWLVITMGGTFKDLSKGPEKCCAFVAKIDADEDTVAKVLKELAPNGDVTIEKQDGNIIYVDEKERTGLVDGKYLIGAGSKEAFEEMFDLYAGKGKASDEFGDLADISGDTVCRIMTAPVSSLLKRFEFARYVEKFGEDSQDKELADMILNMGSISFDIGLADGGETVLRVECGSSSDAKMIEGVFHSLAFVNRLSGDALRYAVKQQFIPDLVDIAKSDLLKKFLRSSEASRSGKTLEIKSGLVSSPFIVAGALFPVISSAMLNANLSTMSMQGRKLNMGILQANIERQNHGLRNVWPRTVLGDDSLIASSDDIAYQTFRSATDYFNALFDMEHYGTSDWDPVVDGELITTLSGCGVPAMTGRSLKSRNVAWSVAANVRDEMPDDMPVLISANFNPALLLRKWDGWTDASKRLPIGSASGASEFPFGNKGIVVVRKSGAVESIKAKFLTYKTLYKGQAFDLTNMDPPLVYLTPTGVVNPVGHR